MVFVTIITGKERSRRAGVMIPGQGGVKEQGPTSQAHQVDSM